MDLNIIIVGEGWWEVVAQRAGNDGVIETCASCRCALLSHWIPAHFPCALSPWAWGAR